MLSPEDVGAWMAVREGGVCIGPKTEGEGTKPRSIHASREMSGRAFVAPWTAPIRTT